MSTRAISLPAHSALEMFAGPAIMVAPFALGFGPAATAVAVAIGALLIGLALSNEGRSTISLAAHRELDYALAVAALAAGAALGLATGIWNEAIFLAGVGAALAALTVGTRFSSVRGA